MDLKEILLESQGHGGSSQNFDNYDDEKDTSGKKIFRKDVDKSTVIIASLVFLIVTITGIVCAYNRVNSTSHEIVNKPKTASTQTTKGDNQTSTSKSASDTKTQTNKDSQEDQETSQAENQQTEHSSAIDQEGVVNINIAGVEELTTIKGIGPKTAQKIIEYRKEHGLFSSPSALTNVKGIGSKTFEKMKDQIKTR